MSSPPLFRDRHVVVQVLTGGVVPAVFGAVVGLVLGESATGYYLLQIPAVIGGILAGFEHRDGWGGADRGLGGGALYGTSLLVAHAPAGTHAPGAPPSFAPLPAAVTPVTGTLPGGPRGRRARARPERCA